jgi:hypothetical protein
MESIHVDDVVRPACGRCSPGFFPVCNRDWATGLFLAMADMVLVDHGDEAQAPRHSMGRAHGFAGE